MSPEEIIRALPQGARVLVQGGAGESLALAQAVERVGREDLSFVGIWLPGVNRQTYGAQHGVRVTCFFLTPELKAAGDSVEFLPLAYSDIRNYLATTRLDACMAMLSPPDVTGGCGFGVAVDFLAEFWPRIPIRIGHLNPATPRTLGRHGVDRADLTYVYEADETLLSLPAELDDPVNLQIAAHFARLTPDNALLQVGIGKAPGACMRALTSKRGLRLHTGFVGEWVLPLIEAGALAPSAITTGVALGSSALYAACSEFTFAPVSHTHDGDVLARQEGLITVNAALEVDLLGQVYSERTSTGFASGPGGALDFARGAKRANGTRVIVLPSLARGQSRIAAPGAATGPVSMSRFDVDIVITEHGAADLRGVSHDMRAARLIAIAAPRARPALREQWERFARAEEAP